MFSRCDILVLFVLSRVQIAGETNQEVAVAGKQTLETVRAVSDVSDSIRTARYATINCFNGPLFGTTRVKKKVKGQGDYSAHKSSIISR